MWTALGAQFDSILLPLIAGVAGVLAAALVPLLLAALTLWIVTQTVGIMTGSSSASWPSLVWNAAIVVAVGGLATTVAFTTGPLYDAWDGVRGEIASAFATASGGLVSAASPWDAIDAMAAAQETALQQIRNAMANKSFYELPEIITLMTGWFILGLGGGLLQIVSGWLVMLTSFLGAFAIALAPLFLAAAAHRASRTYFVNWLTFLLSIALMSGVAMFCLAVSIRLTSWVFLRVGAFGPNLLSTPADFLSVVTTLAIIHALMAVLVFQGPSIAGQMLGAAGIGQGGSLMQTMLLLSRTAGRGAAAAPSGPAPAGRIAGAPSAYASGRAAGVAARYAYQQVASRMSARASTPRT
jgi:type IV secretory pathway VirB6-like protein